MFVCFWTAFVKADVKVCESRRSLSPARNVAQSTEDNTSGELVSLSAVTAMEPVQSETLNAENVKSHNSGADLYQVQMNEHLLLQTIQVSQSQPAISRLIPVPVEHTTLSVQQENVRSGLQLEAQSLLASRISHSVQVLQGAVQVCQISQPSVTYASQQVINNCQESTQASHLASAASQFAHSHQVPLAPQSSPASAQVLLSRSASTSVVRAVSHNLKSAPTPKVIIVSGTGMSTATTISGPPPPAAASSVTSFTSKQSPTKMNVLSVSKTASEVPASALSTGG